MYDAELIKGELQRFLLQQGLVHGKTTAQVYASIFMEQLLDKQRNVLENTVKES